MWGKKPDPKVETAKEVIAELEKPFDKKRDVIIPIVEALIKATEEGRIEWRQTPKRPRVYQVYTWGGVEITLDYESSTSISFCAQDSTLRRKSPKIGGWLFDSAYYNSDDFPLYEKLYLAIRNQPEQLKAWANQVIQQLSWNENNGKTETETGEAAEDTDDTDAE